MSQEMTKDEYIKLLEKRVYNLRKLRREEKENRHKGFSDWYDDLVLRERDSRRKCQDAEDAYFQLLEDYIKLKQSITE